MQSQYYLSFMGYKCRVNGVYNMDAALPGDEQFLVGVLRQCKDRGGKHSSAQSSMSC